MPIIKSAIERVRTSEKAEARNASQLSQMRTAIKKFDKAISIFYILFYFMAQITLTTYTRLLSQQLTVPTLRALSRLTRLHVTSHVSQHVTLSNEKATIKLVAFLFLTFHKKRIRKQIFLSSFCISCPFALLRIL